MTALCEEEEEEENAEQLIFSTPLRNNQPNDCTEHWGVHRNRCKGIGCCMWPNSFRKDRSFKATRKFTLLWNLQVHQTHQRSLVQLLSLPWSTVFLEKLTGSKLVKKFPEFYGTQRFITTFTSARHLSLSCSRSIQPIPPHPTSCRSILILSSNLRLGRCTVYTSSKYIQVSEFYYTGWGRKN